jgi:hypothetical protein
MAKPKIFISSTFYDLKHVRSSLEDFINELGYEPILSEKGNISYDPKIPLDISCYKEAQIADIFVLIIGGRYGSEISEDRSNVSKEFYDKYESVTRKEFNSANDKDIPTYILIEKSVYSEYQTFKRNKDNKNIEYAHVDSVNIFHFIEEILSKPKNNAMFQFEKHSEIKEWLREQWAGLFRELLSQRSEKEQYNSLNEKIEELSSINGSLKTYMETIMKSSADNADEIIEKENEREKYEKMIRDLYKFPLFSELVNNYYVSEEDTISIYKNSKSIREIIKLSIKKSTLEKDEEYLYKKWKDNEMDKQINKIRDILGQKPLSFDDET